MIQSSTNCPNLSVVLKKLGKGTVEAQVSAMMRWNIRDQSLLLWNSYDPQILRYLLKRYVDYLPTCLVWFGCLFSTSQHAL